jgi:hypothetical protein
MSKAKEGLVKAGYSEDSANLIIDEKRDWIISMIAKCKTDLRKEEIRLYEFVDIDKQDDRCVKLDGENLAQWNFNSYKAINEIIERMEILECMFEDIGGHDE